MNRIPDPGEIQQEARALRDGFRTVLLATASSDGVPEASYAPYVLDQQGAVYVFVSELAQHTKNLLAVPRVSLLWITDEQDTRNLFARKRLRLDCNVEEVQRGAEEYETLLLHLEAVQGNTIGLLRQLPDFHLFRFEVIRGSYVRGFGKAYDVTGNELLVTGIQGA